jgi:hypothetical protein
MSVSTKLYLILAFIITLVQKIFSEYSSSLIYTGKVKSLVLIDDWHYLDTHSFFWNQLKGII